MWYGEGNSTKLKRMGRQHLNDQRALSKQNSIVAEQESSKGSSEDSHSSSGENDENHMDQSFNTMNSSSKPTATDLPMDLSNSPLCSIPFQLSMAKLSASLISRSSRWPCMSSLPTPSEMREALSSGTGYKALVQQFMGNFPTPFPDQNLSHLVPSDMLSTRKPRQDNQTTPMQENRQNFSSVTDFKSKLHEKPRTHNNIESDLCGLGSTQLVKIHGPRQWWDGNGTLSYHQLPPASSRAILGQLETHLSASISDRLMKSCGKAHFSNQIDKTMQSSLLRSSSRCSKLLPNTLRAPYTESELSAAVKAICFGRLGTRRAASVYGIPRSTLRNKICKLNELKRREEERLGGACISMADFLEKANTSQQQENSGRMSGSSEKSHMAPTVGKSSHIAGRIASVFQVNCRRSNLARKVTEPRLVTQKRILTKITKHNGMHQCSNQHQNPPSSDQISKCMAGLAAGRLQNSSLSAMSLHQVDSSCSSSGAISSPNPRLKADQMVERIADPKPELEPNQMLAAIQGLTSCYLRAQAIPRLSTTQ